ncbi:MAG TPA: nucleotidyltransferase domain-containing protein [Rhizomicrobium sp.]|nr:nucleotidyltransferase domain-containing protein [Rhizomicrobium sp.]
MSANLVYILVQFFQGTVASCMSASPLLDPILVRFREELDKVYGGRLDRIVLFGSRARGDAMPDSDYDVAVFLRDFVDRWSEMERLVPLVTDILYEQGAFIHAMPYRAGAEQERTPLMHEIRREGREL